jgi:hypothetical protein
MTSRLIAFWEILETNFPLGGLRRHLGELVGEDVVRALEDAGVLKYLRVADRYPCPRPGGEGCPRHVVELDDGSYEAVCGNDPPECPDFPLKKEDLAFLAVVPDELSAAVAKVLQIRAAVEVLPGRRHVFRVGSFIPEAGIKHIIYLAARCNERDYGECLDALKVHAAGQTFAVLVPTERFISEETRRSLASVAAPVIALVDAIDLSDAGLTALVDPLKLFGAIGRHGPGPLATAPSVVARALLRSAGGSAKWHDLDQGAYDHLVSTASQFDIFADELSRSVTKGRGKNRKHKTGVKSSYFRMIRAGADRRSDFDPATDGPSEEGVSGKQIFQRARKAVDLGSRNTWALFKTDIADNHATYRFDPDTSVTFALIFAPTP